MTDYPRSDWSDVQVNWWIMSGPAVGVAIHHTAGRPHMRSYDPAGLRRIEHEAMNRGYNSFAYHTAVMDDGDTAEGRPPWAIGAATGGHNHNTLALCLPGYFHPPYNDYPSDAAIQACARKIREWKAGGFLIQEPIVQPHTWWTAGTKWATSCAGTILNDRVPEIRALAYTDQPPPPSVKKTENDMFIMWMPGQGAFLFLGSLCLRRFTGESGWFGMNQLGLDWWHGHSSRQDNVKWIICDAQEFALLDAAATAQGL